MRLLLDVLLIIILLLNAAGLHCLQVDLRAAQGRVRQLQARLDELAGGKP